MKFTEPVSLGADARSQTNIQTDQHVDRHAGSPYK